MRVLVTNTVCLNGGDAAIAIATAERLRAAFGDDTEVVFADKEPGVARRLHPDMAFVPQLQRRVARPRMRGRARELHRRANVGRFELAARSPLAARLLLRPAERRELRSYASFDLVLSSGGTLLVETYAIWPRLFELRVAELLGLPVVLFTQSLGPFRDPANVRRVREVVRGAAGVMVRDERSRRHLVEVGGDAVRCEDVVFALRPPAPAGERERLAVVSVRDWHHEHADRAGYQRAVADLVCALVREHDLDVALASTCQGVPEYTTDDSVVAQAVWERLPADVAARATVRRDFLRPEALQELLARATVAVCTRMHMAILALTVGTRVLPIAYEFKTTELFARLGRGDDVLDYGAVEPGVLRSTLAAVLERPAPDITAARADAERSGELVRELLAAHR
jgi:colanic acid/amylovoran biosynthesis protein